MPFLVNKFDPVYHFSSLDLNNQADGKDCEC